MPSLIVIPTYNRAHQITRAIEAALGQSQDDVDVAVIDDGSSDASRAACQPWFDHPRFVYVGLGANLGTAGAKNAALALLPFDAVTFHDSDDIPHRDKLLRQQRTLARSDLLADPCLPWQIHGDAQAPGELAELDIVLTAHSFLAADGSVARIARTLSLVDDFFPNLQFAAGPLGDWVLINSGLFRRSLFSRIGGYIDSVEEDRELRNRAIMSGANIWFLDDVLMTKYDQDDSLTAHIATGYHSERRKADRAHVWQAIGEWRSGKPCAPVALDLRDVGLAYVSRPERLAVSHDIAMTDTTRKWLSRSVAAMQ
jgi:glycosyltransferase involved in cell wall biosynthesis